MKITTLSALTGLVASLTLAPSALAVNGCTNSYLNGNYAMQYTGVSAPGVATGIGGLAVPPSMAAAYQQDAAGGTNGTAPTVGLARLALDGNGNLAGYSAANMAGQWIMANVSGAYTVNTDCTFTMLVTDSNNNTENFGGVLINQGSSGIILQTDAGAGISGSLKATRGVCQTSDLFGSYGLSYSGALAGGSPASSVGVVTLDGQGNVTAAETRFSGGSSFQVQSTGSIVVNADCTFTISVASTSNTGGALNFFGIAVADNKQLQIVRSDAATAISGVLSAQ